MLVLALAGCDAGSSPATKAASANRGARLPIPVAVASVKVGSIASYYSTTSTLEVEREAEILARVPGIIRALEAEEGASVGANGLLLRIGNEEYQLRVQQAEAAKLDLQSKLQKLQSLAKLGDGLVSDEELDTARTAVAAAEAQEGLARLNLSYTEVRSEFDARVVKRHVDIGQFVNIDTPLFVVADFNPLLARVHIPAKEFRSIQADQTVELILQSNQAALHGKITLVSPTIDPATGTIKVTVEIPKYPEGTRPGDFADVLIVTEKHPASLLVPRNALLTDNGEQIVFVAINEQAERRVVSVGFTDNHHSEILSGVAARETVVVKGQRSLKHGAEIRVIEDNASAPFEGDTHAGLNAEARNSSL